MINQYKETPGELWACIIILLIIAGLTMEAIIYF